jgi:hypothetical protein
VSQRGSNRAAAEHEHGMATITHNSSGAFYMFIFIKDCDGINST